MNSDDCHTKKRKKMKVENNDEGKNKEEEGGGKEPQTTSNKQQTTRNKQPTTKNQKQQQQTDLRVKDAVARTRFVVAMQ